MRLHLLLAVLGMELGTATYPFWGRLVGVKMGSGRLPTPMCFWACEPVEQLGAGARPCRVTYCCFEHAGQNFGFLDRGPRAVHPM